jgi:hypothetical protein
MIANKLEFTFNDLPLVLTIVSDIEAILCDRERMKFVAKFSRPSPGQPWDLKDVAIHQKPPFPFAAFIGIHPIIAQITQDWLGILEEGEKRLMEVKTP